MLQTKISNTADLLREKGFTLLEGIPEQTLKEAEDCYKILFPPDLKQMLMTFNPYQFYDWTDFSKKNKSSIKQTLQSPFDGILFDIQYNCFWKSSWGEKPIKTDNALELAKQKLQEVPPLIPIYSHRFIPSMPNENGNPVYSVYQTDIIYYGENLWDYFKVEFKAKKHESIRLDKIKPNIPFWSELVQFT